MVKNVSFRLGVFHLILEGGLLPSYQFDLRYFTCLCHFDRDIITINHKGETGQGKILMFSCDIEESHRKPEVSQKYMYLPVARRDTSLEHAF